MSKNEFSGSSCNGSEFSSDPKQCLNEEFSLFQGVFKINFRELSESLKNLLDTEESNRSRSASINSDLLLLTQILTYLLTKNSLCVVIFQNLLHSILSP